MPIDALELLGQVPESGVYLQPFKLLGLFILFTLWALFAQWVDKDTVAVNTFRSIWNQSVVYAGLVALVLFLLLPEFWLGLAAFCVLNLSVGIAYVIHRNGLVVEDDKVCTPAHIKKVLSGGLRGKKQDKKRDVRERVKIVTASRKRLEIPEDDPEREQYALVQDLLFDALWRRATQVEITPAGQSSKIKVLVDGVGTEREPIGRPAGDAILSYLKTIAGLNLAERRRPQRGKLGAQLGEQKYELVVRTNGTTAGEFMSVRVIGAEKSFKIENLGFTDKQLTSVRDLMQADRGLVLISAPPGHGLSTTAYSVARSHDAFLQNIQMLEFEHEYDVDNITQHQYVQSDEKSFAQELLRVVRTDPDVVVLPEVRDATTAAEASKAAIHKQNVYAAIVSADAYEAVAKWIQLAGDAALVSKALIGVTHQRLVRALCPSCKTPYKPDATLMQKISAPPNKPLHRPPDPTFDKHGNPVLCQNCQGTGYVGRTGIFVVLAVDDEIRAAIRSGAADLRSVLARKGGMALQQQGLQKVFDGVTSIDELARATRSAAGPAASAARPAPAASATPRPAAGQQAPRPKA